MIWPVLVLQLEPVILDHLEEREGAPEAFVWTASAEAAIGRAIARAMRGPHGAEEIRRALQIVEALDGELASPLAADALATWLAQGDGVAALIEGRLMSKQATEEVRAFRQREGRDEAPRAPQVDARAPSGALPISRLWNAARAEIPRAAQRELRARGAASLGR